MIEALDTGTAQLLQQDIALLQKIHALLLAEQFHLERAEASALPQITREKQQLTEAFDQRYRQRESSLRALGLPLNIDGMRRWLQQQTHASTVEFNRLWQQFLNLAQEIQALNHLNGRLIEMQLQLLDNRLRSLTQAAGMENTYGANGLSDPGRLSRAHTAA